MIQMKKEKISLKKGEELFIIDCRIRNLADKTIDYYEEEYHYFVEYIENDNIIVDKINSEVIDNYIMFMKNKNLKETTINIRLRGLRSILYFLMNNDYMENFKIRLVEEGEVIQKTYTKEEIKKLLKKPNLKKCSFAEYRTWVLENFLVATGVRSRSLRNIKIDDLDFENEIIYIMTTKNRKSIIIPMSKTLKKILLEYLQIRGKEGQDYLFCNLEGEKLTEYALKNIISKYNKKRGINKTGVHLFRHYYAKEYIKNGGDCLKLKKLLGHSSLEMTQVYVDLYATDLQENYSNLNPLDVLNGNVEKIKMRAV